jgi:hypothetical protein
VKNYYLEDLLDATDHVVEEGSRCALRKRRDGESGSLWVTTRGGEKRKETYSMEGNAYLAEVSEYYVGYKMATRRRVYNTQAKPSPLDHSNTPVLSLFSDRWTV